MKTYDITISHHEKIKANSEEEAKDKFYLSLTRDKNPYSIKYLAFLDSITKIFHQMTIDEINENRMQFGADERRTALGRKFALRTIESINRCSQALTAKDIRTKSLDMVQESLDKWLASVKPSKNWVDRKFSELDYDLEEEINNSASEEELLAT